MKDTAFQLEFFCHTKRKWLPAESSVPYRTWRKVLVGHSWPDKMRAPSGKVKAVNERTRSQVCDDYCKWARLNGVRPTIYADDPISRNAAHAALFNSFELRMVEVPDFIGPAPAAELEP